MKPSILIPAAIAFAFVSSPALAADAVSKPGANPQEITSSATTASAQADAVKKYPQLGQTGSAFKVEFVSRVKRYQKEQPDFFKDPAWPMKLAAEVALAVEEPATASAKPTAVEKGPGPWNDPADPGLWPNQTSRANGDAWLVLNHDRIRQMRPRLLVVNFSNEHSRKHLDGLINAIIGALAESSRYHGYADPQTPVFLQYEVFKFVDLRDADRTKGDSRLVPVRDVNATSGFNLKYAALFTDEFAKGLSNFREVLSGGF